MGELIPALSANLYSPTDFEQNAQIYVKRTTGGADSIRSGISLLRKIEGNADVPAKTAATLTYSKNEPALYRVTIENPTFQYSANVTNTAQDTFEFINVTSTETVTKTRTELAAMGIVISGTMVVNDSFSITYDSTSEPQYAVFLNPVTRFSITVNNSTFYEKVASRVVPGGTITLTFLFDGSSWTESSVAVVLSEYGITLTGTPAGGDTITVTHKRADNGTITFPTATAFKAIGFNSCNCFDSNSMVLEGYAIDASGNVVAQTGSFVCWCEAIYNNADGFTGYTVYDVNKTISRVGWNASVPTASTTGITLSGATLDAELSKVTFTQNGYIVASVGSVNGVCMHPSWSGYMDRTYAPYTESIIEIPVTDANGTALSGQWWAVNTYRNSIDLVNRTYKKSVYRTAYGYSELQVFLASHPGYTENVDYIYDNSWIYFRDTETSVALSDTVSGEYMCNDFSVEMYMGTTVAPVSYHTYGQNLVDKLRTDVVTTQSLESALTTPIVNHTITTGAMSATIAMDAINVFDFSSVSVDTTLTIAFQSVSATNISKCYNMRIKTPASATLTLVLPNGIVWNGGSQPSMTANKTVELSVLDGYGVSCEF